MQPARRLASIAVVAAVGILALSGCRSEPGVAAYIGDQRITEDQVTSVVDDAKRKLPPQPEPEASPPADAPAGAPAPAAAKAPTRSAVVSTLVLGEICRRVSADKGYHAQGTPPADKIAQELGVPADSRFVQLTVELYGCVSGFPAANPVAPTPEELAEVVARGRSAGAIPADVSAQDAGAQLDGDQLRSALASRNMLAEAVGGYRVTVNPRYRPLEFPLLTFSSTVVAVGVPIGKGDTGAVVDPR